MYMHNIIVPAPNKDINSGRAQVLKCIHCGNETYSKDGICVPCKIFPKDIRNLISERKGKVGW
jgi:hypothetical protein